MRVTVYQLTSSHRDWQHREILYVSSTMKDVADMRDESRRAALVKRSDYVEIDGNWFRVNVMAERDPRILAELERRKAEISINSAQREQAKQDKQNDKVHSGQ